MLLVALLPNGCHPTAVNNLLHLCSLPSTAAGSRPTRRSLPGACCSPACATQHTRPSPSLHGTASTTAGTIQVNRKRLVNLATQHPTTAPPKPLSQRRNAATRHASAGQTLVENATHPSAPTQPSACPAAAAPGARTAPV